MFTSTSMSASTPPNIKNENNNKLIASKKCKTYPNVHRFTKCKSYNM